MADTTKNPKPDMPKEVTPELPPDKVAPQKGQPLGDRQPPGSITGKEKPDDN